MAANINVTKRNTLPVLYNINHLDNRYNKDTYKAHMRTALEIKEENEYMQWNIHGKLQHLVI